MARDKVLQMTPLPDFMVPPPLGHVEVDFQKSIRNHTMSRDAAFIETMDSKLFLVQYGFPDETRILSIDPNVFEDEEISEEMSTKLLFLETVSEAESLSEEGNWTDQEYLLGRVRKNLQDADQEEELILTRLKVPGGTLEETTTIEVEMSRKIPLESFHSVRQMKLLESEEDGRTLIVFTHQQAVLRVLIPEDAEDPLDELEESDMLDEPVKLIDWVFDKQSEEIWNVFLNQNDCLYLNTQKIADDVTSFLVYNDFLLYTVSTQIPYDHLFTQKMKHIKTKNHAKPQNHKSSTKTDWRVRNIEKGASLVCTGHDKVILQMPRGNLEGIYSRIFLLKTVHQLVEQGLYRPAFETLRKHKISLSLLVDLNPEGFAEFVKSGRVLSELKSSQLNLLVVEFANQYPKELGFLFEPEDLKKKQEESERVWGQSKVNRLCALLLEQLQTKGFDYVKNEMVVFSKTEPPSLVQGLRRAKQLKEKEEKNQESVLDHLQSQRAQAPHLSRKQYNEEGQLTGSGDNGLNSKRLQNYKDVLKYFCWLVDAEELFRESLLIFDLELAVMVAEFTQKDPKDYLPYIEALKRMDDPLRRKVRICRDLNQDARALEQIRESFAKKKEEISEVYRDLVLEIVQEAGLHSEGLRVFGNDQSLDRRIRESLGRRMLKSKDQKGAADVFLSCGKFADALKCFENILDWRGCVSLIKRMESDISVDELEKKQRAFLEKMKPKFEKLKAYKELAEVKHFLGKSEMQIAETLLQGQMFKEVKSKLTEHELPNNRTNQEELESFKRELLLQTSVKKNEHIESLENLEKWRRRLKQVKKSKRERLEMVKQGLIPEDLGESEHMSAFSQTTTQSASSAFSILTGIGTGNKRRGKKPKNLTRRKVKEGSVYEEEWLAQSINGMLLTPDEDKKVGHLLSLLVRFQEIEEAREVLRVYRRIKVEVENKGVVKTVLQEEFEKEHVEVFEIYSHLREFDTEEISRGSKKIKGKDVLPKFGYLLG